MIFPCLKCGLCCTQAYTIPDFPEPMLPNGTCAHLLPDNTCGVYDRRPQVCNLKKTQKQSGMEELIFYQMQAAWCNKLLKQKGSEDRVHI